MVDRTDLTKKDKEVLKSMGQKYKHTEDTPEQILAHRESVLATRTQPKKETPQTFLKVSFSIISRYLLIIGTPAGLAALDLGAIGLRLFKNTRELS